MFTEVVAISVMVGIGTLAGAKLLGDFDAELRDLGAAVRGGDASCPSPAGSASGVASGVSIAGDADFAVGIADGPQGNRSGPAARQTTQDVPAE
jgi:hypothetical protein